MRKLNETIPAFFAFYCFLFFHLFICLVCGGIDINSFTLLFFGALGAIISGYKFINYIIIIKRQFKEVRRIDNEKISEHSENMEDRTH